MKWWCYYEDEHRYIKKYEITANSLEDAIDQHSSKHGIKPILAILKKDYIGAVFALLYEQFGVIKL